MKSTALALMPVSSRRLVSLTLGLLLFAAAPGVLRGEAEREVIQAKDLMNCCVGLEQIRLEGTEYTLDPPEGEMVSLVKNIFNYTGLEPNFVIRRIDGINNAIATVYNNKRYLIYDSKLLRRWANDGGNDWTVLGVLAHEIGHHVQGHLFGADGDAHKEELEADGYAGWVQGLMGASKNEALQFANGLSMEDSESHPGRPKRLVAIAAGWDRAQRTIGKISKPKVAGNRCPLVRLDDPDLAKEVFVGMVGADSGKCTLGLGVDGSVRGLFEPGNAGERGSWKLIGKFEDGRMTLEQYEGCEIVGNWELTSWQDDDQRGWSGTRKNSQGKTSPVVLTVSKAPVFPTFETPKPVPAPKPESSPKGPQRFISVIGGFKDSWFCAMNTGTGYAAQTVTHSAKFPLDWIRKNYADGYRITQLAGDASYWACAMSKGTSLTDQQILGPGPLPETDYVAYRDQGYRITAVAGFQSTWVFVMSRGSGLAEQSFSRPGPWPADLIRKRWDSGYRITSVAGDEHKDGHTWLVVLSKGSGIGAQSYSEGAGFPVAWLKEKRANGYDLTAAAGYTNWHLIMSKTTGKSQSAQWFPDTWVTKPFPIDFIQAGYDGK